MKAISTQSFSRRAMRTRSSVRAPWLALALVLVALLQLAAPVSAKRWVPPPAPSEIVIAPAGPFKLGDPLEIVAQLRDQKGNVLTDRALDFSIDFAYFGQARTDTNGIASYQSRQKLPAGEHVITVEYQGAKDYLPVRISRKMIIQPALVAVQTFPPLAGVIYNMDGRDFVTDANGVASVLIFKVGRYTLSAYPERYNSPNTRIQFGRWETESYQPFRDVDVPLTEPIQAGMEVFHRVGQSFADLDGLPVDPQRIEKVTIKSIQGDVFSYMDNQMHWVPASRVARRLNGLEVTPLQYSVMDVQVDGSNVVNQAQQRFFIQPEAVWKVQLLLYSMHVTTRDALFGSAVGKHVRVEFPNGEVHSYPLDSNGAVDIHSLARGIYKIQVTGVQGMASLTPVALSRNQTVSLQVISNQDMLAVGALGVLLAVGLILVGRPWLLLPALRRKRAHARHADGDMAPEVEGIASIHNN